MIAACPKCDARYRVDEAKLGSAGARLRCAKCQAVFRVRAPQAPSPSFAEATEPVARSQPPAAAPAPPAAAEAVPRQPPVAASPSQQAGIPESPSDQSYDRERLVLVADPRDDAGKEMVSALDSWGLQTILVRDGVEAMLSIQRSLPRVVILDAALPKMYGFQVCEVVKRNESLRDTKVVLVGAIHNRDRYRRPPVDLYGADIYLEQPDMPEGMRDLLIQFGLPVRDPAAPGPVAVATEPIAAPPSAPVAQAAEPEPELELEAPPAQPSPPATPTPAADDGLGEEREKAERLARIVVSDIILYQGERFDEAIRAGNLLESLDSEIEEGRSFFRQRISEPVRSERDFVVDELMRIARERGMT